MATLPYVTATGNVERALKGIKAAATPDSVSQDFVKTILKIPGGSGNQMTSYLRKVGFVNPDGSPSDIYKRFRNAASSGTAAAEALRIGYAPLYKRNEYMHQLSDDELRGLIIEETGQGEGSSVVNLVVSCIKAIRKFAKWTGDDAVEAEESAAAPASAASPGETPGPAAAGLHGRAPGLNLSYTINLNLPATSDVAVFNAIFKSLKDNLLRDQ